MKVNKKLDVRYKNCPLPILITKKEINKLNSGELLQIITTDPGSLKDMEAYCNQTEHTLVSIFEKEFEFEFIIKKK